MLGAPAPSPGQPFKFKSALQTACSPTSLLSPRPPRLDPSEGEAPCQDRPETRSDRSPAETGPPPLVLTTTPPRPRPTQSQVLEANKRPGAERGARSGRSWYEEASLPEPADHGHVLLLSNMLLEPSHLLAPHLRLLLSRNS